MEMKISHFHYVDCECSVRIQGGSFSLGLILPHCLYNPPASDLYSFPPCKMGSRFLRNIGNHPYGYMVS
jgi:hypothetical protein